eukprot:TRINITY_DN10329_c0_g1_i1.p2 TRINITY_DN10329_c0_g1~~TRINITY_DN10329_c0_g1_i1.p2  ORF type:complete len:220 (-),score=11.84 TRINITY_DN10329_c0_g1_i1:813-1472(-)
MPRGRVGHVVPQTIFGRPRVYCAHRPPLPEEDTEPYRLLVSVARWRLRLSEFEFDVVYRAGVKHQAPDALSRMDIDGLDNSPLNDDIPCFAMELSGNCDCLVATVQDGNVLHENAFLDWDEPPKGHHDRRPTGTAALAVEDEQTEPLPIPVEEFLEEQAKDPWCKGIAKHVGTAPFRFGYDHHGFLSRTSPLDGAVQHLVPPSLRDRVLYLSQYAQAVA